jgi:hypothetical protein
LRDAAEIGGRDRSAGARIDGSVERDRLRPEELLDVRRADGTVEGCTEANVADRRKFR